jgi:hypothetical protein
MSKYQIFSTLVPALITGIVVAGSLTISQAESAVTISVLASGDPCPCGSHGGGFEALYDTRKISINFSHNQNPANPVKHPIIVLKNNKNIKGWDSLICSYGSDKCPLAGSKITVSGRWKNKTSFEAYKIWIK